MTDSRIYVDADHDDTLDCPICMELLRDGVELNPCRHYACRGCSAHLSQCPLCRSPIRSQGTMPPMLRSLIGSVLRQCTSCTWRGAPEGAAGHCCAEHRARPPLSPLQYKSFFPNMPLPFIEKHHRVAVEVGSSHEVFQNTLLDEWTRAERQGQSQPGAADPSASEAGRVLGVVLKRRDGGMAIGLDGFVNGTLFDFRDELPQWTFVTFVPVAGAATEVRPLHRGVVSYVDSAKPLGGITRDGDTTSYFFMGKFHKGDHVSFTLKKNPKKESTEMADDIYLRQSGTVQSFDAAKHQGVVSLDSGVRLLFFSGSQKVGDRVTFLQRPNPKRANGGIAVDVHASAEVVPQQSGNVKVKVHLLWDYANVKAPGSLLQDIRRTVEAAERQVECIVQPTVFVVNGVTPQAEIDDLRKYGCLIISASTKREDADRNLVNRLTELTTTHQITSATPIVIVSGDQDFVEPVIRSRGTHQCSVYVFSNATKGSDHARRLEFGCTKHFHVADISARTSSPPVAASELCVHYQKGTCKFGDRCKKAHVISAGHGQ